MPKPLAAHLEVLLSAHCGTATAIHHAEETYGGSINDGYRLDTTSGRFFLKVNEADLFPGLFISEADGLALLRSAGELRVPDVIGQGEVDDTTFLLMEFIPSGEEGPGFQGDLGRALARLHRHTQPTFGLDRDNHIGLLRQVNTPHDKWVDFLVQCRFEPLVKKAHDNKRIHPGDMLRFERLYGRLDGWLPVEAPVLLHGDLWKNNYIAAPDGEAVLIDPAVYYGHREMDLAMTRLFGGFDRDFYAAYHEEFPLEQGWEDRMDLCNLYPLLVHLNLFGGSYADRVGAVLRQYV
ncbi:MAG TPA: fructosamine kinase family protein [Flavobacteriales bacterium]|nr:fructosamine kinase family protein [Flavobacteriales bacterium]